MHRSFKYPGWLLISGVMLAGAVGVSAAESSASMTQHLRELTTDRPDATESPFTVDRNHLQIEMDVASYTRDELDGLRTTEWSVAPFNLRYGFARNAEAGIFISPLVRVTAQPRGEAKKTTSGVGDTTLRMKLNFWGNEGGPTAFGIMADVKLPTAAINVDEHTEGALTFPLALELGGGWAGAGMTSVELRHVGNIRRTVWVNTITFAREFLPDTGGFLELTSEAGDERHVATFNCGITRAFGPRLKLDFGVYIGISRLAPDLTVFAGLARKF
jgi:hypothetical protein